MRLRNSRLGAVLLATLCAGAGYAAFQQQRQHQAATRAASAPLASYAPPDALLAIEAPDFAGLLKSWNSSAEQKRWLASDNYAAFVQSRLSQRLEQAQQEFATTASLDVNAQFLQRIAGGRSLLAWYDIGNLEFLYITHLRPGQGARTPLLQLRDKFEQRKVGNSVFFVRTEDGKDGAATRTVAFAVRGDDLLLATREDLLADALQRMQKPDPQARTLAQDSWYAGTVAAAGPARGDLRMTLNLAKIVASPYFRTYWLQQNITEMKQYKAALCDLVRTPAGIVDQRTLLSADPARATPASDLKPLQAYVPGGVGVYRITAQPSVAEMLDALEDKLLSRGPGAYRDPYAAPIADLSTPVTSAEGDLERRIDEPLVVSQPRAHDLTPLRTFLEATPATAMLTFATATGTAPKSKDAVFRSVHTAVAFSANSPWDEAALRKALTAALSARLSVGTAGLAWVRHGEPNASWYTLLGAATLTMACRAGVCLVASDEATLSSLLAAPAKFSSNENLVATIVAGYRHGAEHEALESIAATLTRGTPPVALMSGQTSPPPAPPAFLSGNVASLSRTFQDVDTETFKEASSTPGITTQIVTYRWRR